ncbi:MAG: hypothetical protein ACXVW2_02660 [Nocardioidaceae bacterium]
MSELGERFAKAMAAKDSAVLGELLAAEVDFKALTPQRFWEAGTPAEIVEVFFGTWFGPEREIRSLLDTRTGSVGERESVTYRLSLVTPDGPCEAEQRAYYSVVDGRIGFLRILCSGIMPVPGGHAGPTPT